MRLRILNAETAGIIDMHNVLNDVIKSVPQETGVNTDIRVGTVYTLARQSREPGQRLQGSRSAASRSVRSTSRWARVSRFSLRCPR